MSKKIRQTKTAWFAIIAEFVTTEDGTGIVHIAPGHGAEDYMAGMANGLAIYSPVKDNGCYDDTVPAWLVGKSVLKVDQRSHRASQQNRPARPDSKNHPQLPPLLAQQNARHLPRHRTVVCQRR